jgi:nucleotide-binding universal stress UspA family protein
MTDALSVRKLLVPVDGSACSRFAADQAVRIAAAFGAEIIFLHAVDDHVVEVLAEFDSEDARRPLRDRLVENGRAHLREAARLADACRVRHREEIGHGDPCVVICEAAQGHDVDCIIMGKTGRRGTRRILTGSVTRRVTESTDRPLLIVSGPRPGATAQ